MLIELLYDFSSAKVECSSAVWYACWSPLAVRKGSLVSSRTEGSSDIFGVFWLAFDGGVLNEGVASGGVELHVDGQLLELCC